jgi:hypothetical protein
VGEDEITVNALRRRGPAAQEQLSPPVASSLSGTCVPATARQLTFSIGESDPSSHAKLKTVERYVAAAEARIAQLKDHLEYLRRIEAAVTPLSHGTDGPSEHASQRRAV